MLDQVRRKLVDYQSQGDGEWIIYLIGDPQSPDKLGNNAGTPIYVGQTKDYRTRVRSRFDRCERSATPRDMIEKRVVDLLHTGFVARCEVLERTPTRLTSLVSETNWARRCVARGYDIANRLSVENAFTLAGWANQFDPKPLHCGILKVARPTPVSRIIHRPMMEY